MCNVVFIAAILLIIYGLAQVDWDEFFEVGFSIFGVMIVVGIIMATINFIRENTDLVLAVALGVALIAAVVYAILYKLHIDRRKLLIAKSVI